jgi:hypothetical protein
MRNGQEFVAALQREPDVAGFWNCEELTSGCGEVGRISTQEIEDRGICSAWRHTVRQVYRSDMEQKFTTKKPGNVRPACQNTDGFV